MALWRWLARPARWYVLVVAALACTATVTSLIGGLYLHIIVFAITLPASVAVYSVASGFLWLMLSISEMPWLGLLTAPTYLMAGVLAGLCNAVLGQLLWRVTAGCTQRTRGTVRAN